MRISDLIADNLNANRGTKRGRDAVSRSLQDYGAGRSVLIDRDGRIIAGNKTVEQASAAGITEVLVVPTDGTQIVAVQRTDISLDDVKGRGLAIADNRTVELGLEWHPEILGQLASELDLKPFFTDDELSELTGLSDALAPAPNAPEVPQGRYKQQYGVIVLCKDEAEQQEVYEKLTGGGLACRVVVT